MMDRDEEKYQGYYLPPALGEQIKKAVAHCDRRRERNRPGRVALHPGPLPVLLRHPGC